MKIKCRKYPDLRKLKARMVEVGETYRTLSKKSGIALCSLNNKLNGYTLFDIAEVASVCSVLRIPPNDIPELFSQDFK